SPLWRRSACRQRRTATNAESGFDVGRARRGDQPMSSGEETGALPPRHQMLPPGWVAEVVTYLEMRAPPPSRPDMAAGLALQRMTADVDAFRKLFRRVGEPWLWASQLRHSDS